MKIKLENKDNEFEKNEPKPTDTGLFSYLEVAIKEFRNVKVYRFC